MVIGRRINIQLESVLPVTAATIIPSQENSL